MAGSLGVAIQSTVATAQIREQQPAEFPPTSYKGKQYVDSQGCVFIRAGIDGNVSWVPRVSRDRKTVCGFKPTNAGSVAAAPAAPAPAPVQITLDDATTTAAPAPAARPAPRRTAQVAAPAPRRVAKPKVVRQTARRAAPKPAPRIVAPAPQVIRPAPQVRRVTTAPQAAAGCGATAISRQYMRGEGVRCGPQSEPIIGNRTAAVVPQARAYGQQTAGHTTAIRPHYNTGHTISSNTRIVPKHVAKRRINTTNVNVPKGYREVWDDDRLNPRRAEQTLGGRSQMLLVWTQTVPRRLINQSTGRDVTASVPLIYPYTSVAQQRRELGEVSIVRRDGQIVKKIIRNAGAKPVERQPVYSSRSAPAKVEPKAQVRQQVAKPAKALAGKRYVQVGTFRNGTNAQRTAQNVARMGMPARIGKHRKGGQTYMTVQAGPFNGPRAMQQAMNRLRSAGYSDAFAR
ncbi:Sporulation domain protein [Sulfitobacter noctilucicola]|nr:Sporulation domain protein [Sulfitobacter noctilucicola]